ncbi:MAG: HAD-IIB family hydrolase [Pseudomonadota bacterium]|nr:HAD-IIB family hydrolase [Pseudomonadota bacterium]
MSPPAIPRGPAVVFTDLDGSLLDHHGYSHAGAAPTLARIREKGTPLILVTSKTRSEVEEIRRELGNADPFIVENGGAAYFPRSGPYRCLAAGEETGAYRRIAFGRSYGEIRAFLCSLGRQENRAATIRGFGDMDVEEIMALTGLDAARAGMAQRREFSEPFLIAGESDAAAAACLRKLAAAARRRGFTITRGGRFHHLLGAGQNKGRAVAAAARIMQGLAGGEITTVGVGDSENDLTMLAVVDIPVLIPRPCRGFPAGAPAGTIRATRPGSEGWNEAIGKVLDGLTGAGG